MVRWLFRGESHGTEAAERHRLSGFIDDWWAAFNTRRADLDALFDGRSQWDLVAWMHEHLHAIDERIMWEFGPALKGDGHRLVLTPEADRQLRPLVGEILRKAPEVDGWEFHPHRPAEPFEVAAEAVRARCGGSIDGWRVQANAGDGNFINLAFLAPGLKSRQTGEAMGCAFVAVESLLGEKMLDQWIGDINVRPAPSSRGLFGKRKPGDHAAEAAPLDDLQSIAMREAARIRAALPAEPHQEWVSEDGEWAMLSLSPTEAPDYAGQDDLFVATVANVPLFKAMHVSGRFFDERFTRCNERFCYLKIDGADRSTEERLPIRSALENAIDAALRQEMLGCVIGSGMGIRYAYIELALTDVRRASKLVRRQLQDLNAPDRSWLLFHHADLAAEWLGAHDDSPPPMMRDE